jgi:hypothetical protein
MVALERLLRELAGRKTFCIATELKKVGKHAVTPRTSLTLIPRIRVLVASAIAAYVPGVVFPPYTQALIALLAEEGYLEDGAASSRAGMWYAALYVEHKSQLEFLRRLWETLRSEAFVLGLRRRTNAAAGAERSLLAMTHAAMRSRPKGVWVLAADLYARTVPPGGAPAQRMAMAKDDIAHLLRARKSFVKRSLNASKGPLSAAEWFMLPVVGASGCPYITVWLFLDGDMGLSEKREVGDLVAQEWARVAGKESVCFVYRKDAFVGGRSVPADLLCVENKRAVKAAHNALRNLSGALAWILPDLPKGTDSFWRSERIHFDRKKKHNWGAAAMIIRRAESISFRKKVSKQNKALIGDLKASERVISTDRVSGTPAAFGGDDDVAKIFDQKVHQEILAKKIESDDLLAETDAISRKIGKQSSGVVDRVTVPVDRMDVLSHFISTPSMLAQMAYAPSPGLFGPDVPLAPPPIPQYPPSDPVMEQAPWSSHDLDHPQAAPPIPHYPLSVPVVGQDTPPTANLTASNVGVGDGGEGTSNSSEGGAATSLGKAMSSAAKRLAEE